MSAHLRQAWARRIVAAGETIWRGLNVKFPADVEAQIDKLAEMPTEEWQIGQRYKIAPLVVDFLKSYRSHWDTDRSPGLGRHWTTRKDWAEKAAMQGNYGGTWVLLSGTYDPSGVDHEHSYAGTQEAWETENEVTLLPGARVTITGVYVARYGLDFKENLCKTPIRTVAAKFSPSQVATWEQTKPWNASRQDLEWQNVPGIYVGQARGSEDASFEGDRIVVKEQWFGRSPEVRRAVLYHEAGHALEARFSGTEALPTFGLDSLYDVMDWRGAQGLGPDYSEALAEAYAAVWTDPSWFGSRGDPKWRNLIEWMACKEGFPLP